MIPQALYDQLSFFEVSTLLACHHFATCDVAVFEVGLGGRWDATNALDPVSSAVVSIDRDHEGWLGHDLGGIAREKLGIARQGRPLFWGEGAMTGPERQGIGAMLESEEQRQGFF